MIDWPQSYVNADEVLADDDPWMVWALKITRDVQGASAAYGVAQGVAKALRAAYWRGQGECGCEPR